jgi:outer membrane protein assembly factor BamB
MAQKSRRPDVERSQPSFRRCFRWWPGAVLALLAAGAVGWIRAQADWPFQQRNLASYILLALAALLLVLWWTFFSRVPRRLRLCVTFGLIVLAAAGAVLFRVRGVSGDLRPIFEFRWAKWETQAFPAAAAKPEHGREAMPSPDANANAFPQFYGPHRDGVLAGPRLETNWTAHPPQVLWRSPVGAGWSGFAILGSVCLTQEQQGADEDVVARDLAGGQELWRHTDAARYNSPIAGEGPRATPTVVGQRVYTFGATGVLNCLDLASGRRLWSRDVVKEFGGKVPIWGAASSPLVLGRRVLVHAGEGGGHSLLAFDSDSGAPLWQSQGNPSYATPVLATVAGVSQVLAFNHRAIAGYDPANGATLWECPWGSGDAVCSSPVVVSSNRVLYSSGYGVGAQLIELTRQTNGALSAERVWKSIRMKSKFAHLFIRDGCLFGLDDGIFACVDLKDGSQCWKEGRYGHGQGLLVGEVYVLMSEAGELVLLRPTRLAPNELGRFRVFDSKTWNPPALAGDRLLVRNDREAACLRLPLAP